MRKGPLSRLFRRLFLQSLRTAFEAGSSNLRDNLPQLVDHFHGATPVMRPILVIMKGRLDRAVPIISVARHFAAMGHHVSIACGTCDQTLHDFLKDDGIVVTELAANQPKRWLPRVVRKIIEWGNFRKHARAMLRVRFGLLYVGSADTAIALWGLLHQRDYILHLRELHDTQKLYMRALGPIARNARHVVVPEINRAHIYKSLLSLQRTPSVIPNKPFSHPARAQLNIDFLSVELREQIASRKCIVYQGPIHPERDLTPVLRVLARNSEYAMVVMGRDYGVLGGYREILPDLIHIPFVTPPNHLNITSWAHIGLIAYDNKSLNTIYCAPNKIWEYSGFGLPMLCSDNLGLRYTVGAAGAAKLVDLEDYKAVDAALRQIEEEYQVMKNSSHVFFSSIDIAKTLSSLLMETNVKK